DYIINNTATQAGGGVAVFFGDLTSNDTIFVFAPIDRVALTVRANAGGSLDPGVYICQYTWITAAGETAPSAEFPFLIAHPGYVLDITIPKPPPGVIAWNLYLTMAGADSRDITQTEVLYQPNIPVTTTTVACIARNTGSIRPPSYVASNHAGVADDVYMDSFI